MANNDKSLEHVIRGYIPHEELAKLIKEHFVPEGVEKPAAAARTSPRGATCTGMGCPSTHPISGTVLTGCTTSTESDGSTTIHCYYAPITKHV